MKRIVLPIMVLFLIGCGAKLRQPEIPTGPSLKVMTWNVNWGGPAPELAVQTILEADADIVCLQETTESWERYLRERLSARYPFMTFRPPSWRYAGGLAFLAKEPGEQVAFIPSDTGWFDAWIMRFRTQIGPVQIKNVHLQPIANDAGSLTIAAYFSSGKKHEREIRRFNNGLAAGVPTLVVGDFNEGDGGSAVKWLEKQGMTNALPEFDRNSHTWWWDLGWITLRKRLDHILYSPELHCHSACVLQAEASDHLPVVAVFGLKQDEKKEGTGAAKD